MKNKKGKVIWFTGLSGSGKTTIAKAVIEKLHKEGIECDHLDGDELRSNITSHLSFSESDRRLNIDIAGFVANKLSSHGVIVLVTLISPFRDQRERLKDDIDDFYEVYVSTSLEVCEKRDVKGLYARVRAGEIKNFTGVDSVYEPPLNPELELDASVLSVEECVDKILMLIKI